MGWGVHTAEVQRRGKCAVPRSAIPRTPGFSPPPTTGGAAKTRLGPVAPAAAVYGGPAAGKIPPPPRAASSPDHKTEQVETTHKPPANPPSTASKTRLATIPLPTPKHPVQGPPRPERAPPVMKNVCSHGLSRTRKAMSHGLLRTSGVLSDAWFPVMRRATVNHGLAAARLVKGRRRGRAVPPTGGLIYVPEPETLAPASPVTAMFIAFTRVRISRSRAPWVQPNRARRAIG